MSSPTSDMILIVLKAVVERNFISGRWQDCGSSESYRYRLKKLVDPPKKEMLNVGDPYFSQFVESIREGG